MAQVSYGSITITDTNDIESIIVEYNRNQSTSEAPSQGDSGWSTTRPTWAQGYYIWQRTRIHKSGTEASEDTFGAAVCLTGSTGQTGAAGRSLTGTVTKYTNVAANSTQAQVEALAENAWLNNVPAYDSNKPEYWVRVTNTYDKAPLTENIYYKDQGLTDAIATANQANATANAANQTANTANQTANAASALATGISQHFWSLAEDTVTTGGTLAAGQYITDILQDNFKQNPNSSGNLLLRSDGVYLNLGLRTLASFKSNALIFYNAAGGELGRFGSTGLDMSGNLNIKGGGRIGQDTDNYWKFGDYTSYASHDMAYLMGYGEASIQLGEQGHWRLDKNRIHAGWYQLNDATLGVLHFDTAQDTVEGVTNTYYWDYGLNYPNRSNNTGNNKFVYIRRSNDTTNTTLATMKSRIDDDAWWTYKFYIDGNGNLHAGDIYSNGQLISGQSAPYLLKSGGTMTGSITMSNGGTFIGNLTGNADTATTAGAVTNSLKIQFNSGTTEDTNQFTYNGSTTKNINITKSSIGLGNVENTTLSTWAGSFSLTTTKVGTLAEAATKGVDTSIAAASTSTKLPTSAAVAAFVEGKGYITSYVNTTYSLTQDLSDGHKITLTPSSGTAQTITIPDNNTTYTFANGTNGFTVTPSGGTAQTVTVTPSIANNVTGSGTSGYLVKWNGTNTITNGPQLGSGTTTFLRNDGTWAIPIGSTYTAGNGLRLSGSQFINTRIPFVVGTQTAATGSWTGVCNDITALYDGLTIAYWLPYAGSGNATLNLTINGIATGAKNCYYGGTSRLTTHFGAGNIIYLTYRSAGNINGTNYEGWWANANYNSDYTIGYSWTAANTAAKSFTASYFYTNATKCWFPLCLIYGNTYAGAITFNLNGAGAKPVYINGNASSANNYALERGYYLVYWDGTNFYVRTDGKITGSITGDAATVGGYTVGINVPSNAIFTDTWKALSTSQAGYVAQAPNDTSKFLRGDATWAAVTKSNVGLGNVTNDKQIKGLSSGTTSGHLVTWGSDGYTVADSGITKGNIVKSVGSNNSGQLVLTYADNTTSDPIDVTFVATIASSATLADALNVNGTAVGSATVPVYFDNQGKPQTANTIPKLNNTTTGGIFYAPTGTGSNGQILISSGSGAPTWTDPANITSGNKDEKIKLTNTTGSADYRVLLSYNANDNNNTEEGRKSTSLRFNPSTGLLKTYGISSVNGSIPVIYSEVTNADVTAVNSSLTSNSSDSDWLKALIAAICIKYPSKTGYIFKGTLSPNSVGWYEIYIYNTSAIDNTTKLPQYSFGRFIKYINNYELFGTSSYSYSYRTVDTNTTYSAGTGISLSGTTFSNSGVCSISTGNTNGTISVNTGGSSAEVAVKGLGSAAFVNTSLFPVVSTYSLPAAKAVRIQYPTYVPVLISAQRSNSGGRLILLGGGYGAEGTVRNDFQEVVSSNVSSFTWTLPSSSSISNSIEIMNVNTSGAATITVWTSTAVTFTEISALSNEAMNKVIVTSANYTNYTVTKTGSGASGTWGISISGNAATATTATKATQDADGNDIRQKYVNVYNTSNIGSSSSVTFTDLAAAGNAVAMINNATDNPTGSAKWTHAISLCWSKGSSANWISQIALGTADGNGMWYRTTSGNIAGLAWKRILDSSNYTDYTVTKTGTGASGTWGISISGSAVTLSTTAVLTSSHDENSYTGTNVIKLYGHSNTNRPSNCPEASYNAGLLVLPSGRGTDTFQLEYSCNTGDLYTRSWLSGSTPPSWQTLLNSNNYTSYTVTKNGTGATGTWGISISGTAAKATADKNGNDITTKYVTIDTDQTITASQKTLTGATRWSSSANTAKYGAAHYDSTLEAIVFSFA